MTFAGGLARQGVRPVVAIYSTFLQRAYDNIIHDIAVQKLPVIFCMDRAGLVGEDGQTHMGLYDIAYMLAVPGMTVTAPKDADELIGLLRAGLEHDGPFCTRYPRDKAPLDPNPVQSVPAVPYGTWELLRPGQGVAILGVGTMALPAVAAAELLSAQGIDAAAVNARFLKPMDEVMLASLVRECPLLVTVEEGTIVNGFGAALARRMQETNPEVRVLALGIADELMAQTSRAEQLARQGLTPSGIAASIQAHLAAARPR